MEQLRQEYAELLAIHLECPEELHLFEAYTFGKKCAEKGIPASEVINSHFEILENGEVPLGEERVLDSQEFLLETILAIAASSSSVIEATMPEKVLAVLYNEAATRFRELREVKERLRVSESKYRELYDEAMAMLCSIDQNGSITICNNTMAKNLGYEKEDLIGKQVATILSPECVERVWNKESGSLRGQEEVECLLLKRDGQAIRALVQAKAVFSEDVMPSHFDFTCRDITERKRAEEEQEKLHEQLRQAQKMESIGRLAGGVAHDFNNMLSIILGYTEMALDGMEPALPLFARLHEIRKAAERSANLTQQLLAFARKQTVAPKVIDLNKTVDGMLKMLRRLIREDIDLSWLPGSGLWPVKIDPLQIDQILANLCVNARDAITGVGKLTIETENTVFDEAYCAEHAGFVCGEYLLLAVSDDGCGMNKETLEKIFEPFFTTKGAGKGTGLGLATVYGIVKQNSGFMNVTSEPGHGTTFRIYLPRHKGEANCIPEEGAPAHATRGDQTILLVEDEPSILNMTTTMLESLGYIVLAEERPSLAIRLAEAHPGEIDLLMTDVVMPEMNGRDLARNLLPLYPNLKHLFMSGYTANVIAHHGVLDGGIHFIQKPFSKRDLAVKLREVLEGNDGRCGGMAFGDGPHHCPELSGKRFEN